MNYCIVIDNSSNYSKVLGSGQNSRLVRAAATRRSSMPSSPAFAARRVTRSVLIHQFFVSVPPGLLERCLRYGAESPQLLTQQQQKIARVAPLWVGESASLEGDF